MGTGVVFNTFPLVIGPWSGRDEVIEDQSVLDTLGADDYFLANYTNREDGQSASLWIAYYEEQRKGRAGGGNASAALDVSKLDLGNTLVDGIVRNGVGDIEVLKIQPECEDAFLLVVR